MVEEGACYSATEYLTNYTFNPPKSGDVRGVGLYHVSGWVTGAKGDGGSYFGTISTSDNILVLLTRNNSELETLLPNDDTDYVYDVVSMSDSVDGASCGCSIWQYRMTDYNVSSKILLWDNSGNPIEVDANDTLSLQYSEGCCDVTTEDNVGTACADVYFEYESYG